jgi:hypothetical protein
LTLDDEVSMIGGGVDSDSSPGPSIHMWSTLLAGGNFEQSRDDGHENPNSMSTG